LLPASRDQRPRAPPAITGSGERRGRHYPRALCLSRDRRAQRPLASEGCREDLSCAKPVRGRTPQDAGQSQRRKDEGGSFRGSQFGVGDPFPVSPFAYPSAWKDGELQPLMSTARPAHCSLDPEWRHSLAVCRREQTLTSATTRPASIHLGPFRSPSWIARNAGLEVRCTHERRAGGKALCAR
jgi:hypothetical protein